MFTTVVWATDGSEFSDAALVYAVEIAVRDGAELHAVHVVEKLASGRAAGLELYVNEDEIRAKVAQQARTAHETSDLVPHLHIIPGRMTHVADRIRDVAQDVGADLIVVGTRGHGSVSTLVLGSVTQRLLHVSSCPVLAVPPSAKVPSGAAPDVTTTTAA